MSWKALGCHLIRTRGLCLCQEIRTMLSVAFLSLHCEIRPQFVTFLREIDQCTLQSWVPEYPYLSAPPVLRNCERLFVDLSRRLLSPRRCLAEQCQLPLQYEMSAFVFENAPAAVEDPSIRFQGPLAAIFPMVFDWTEYKKNLPQLLLSIK